MDPVDPPPPEPFFLIIANQDRGYFAVEGPMTDDQPWQNAARSLNSRHYRRITCGPAGPDRDVLAAEFQRTHKFGGVPPAVSCSRADDRPTSRRHPVQRGHDRDRHLI